MGSTTETSALAAALGRRLRGEAIGPDAPEYERARRGHNRSIDRRPALIARCADAADVSAAVRFARAEGLALAVRGGGHSLPGFCSLDGGLVIDLTAMRSVRVDAAARSATLGGGATVGDLDRATHAFGLATPGPTVSTVGMGGFTLGGGIGYLNRAHGLAADNLIGAEVVLADGRRVHANSDLLWALRGGGGNFGVVTELRLRLHRVGTVLGGPILWPLEDAQEILGLYGGWLAEQPDDVYAFFALLTVPPADPFPEPLRLRRACALVFCNTGPRSRAAVDDLLAAAPRPLLDAVAELPYPALQTAFDPLAAAGRHNQVAGHCFASLPAAAAEQFAPFGERAPTPLSFTHLYPLDGAAARGSDGAWPWRGAAFAQMILGVSGEPGHDGELREWASGFAAALAPYALGGGYSSFLMDDGPEQARAAYGASYEPLARVKARYDPDNVFRVNQNVRPSA